QSHDALHAGYERLLDAPGKLQIAPDHDVYRPERDDGWLHDRSHSRSVLADVARELTVQPRPEGLEEVHRSSLPSGGRLKASREPALSIDGPLAILLLTGPALRVGGCNQHEELGLFVLEHDLLRTNPCVQVQNALLVAGRTDAVDEL